MEELRENLSQLFSFNFFSSIVNIRLEHLNILCYVCIVQDLLRNLSKHTKKQNKNKQTQVYTQYGFFTCMGLKERQMGMNGFKYCGTKFAFVNMIC